jgi:steroid delta-isomerase-like uncharacterized protein
MFAGPLDTVIRASHVTESSESDVDYLSLRGLPEILRVWREAVEYGAALPATSLACGSARMHYYPGRIVTRPPSQKIAGAPMSAEVNKAIVRRWFEEIDKRNFAIIDELIPEDYVDHNPPLPDLPPGREGVRQSSLRLYAAFPDAVHILEDQIADGDKVMTRMTVRATFLGEIFGFQPTGKTVEVSGMTVHRVANGQLVEHWAHLDMTGFMEQIGAPAE